MSPSDRKPLIDAGVRFIQYIPTNAYFIWADENALYSLEQSDLLNGIIEIPLEAKIDASLRSEIEEPASSSSLYPQNTQPINVKILFFPDTTFSEAFVILQAHGAISETTRDSFDYHQTLNSVSIPSQNIRGLAAEESIFLITETDPPLRPCNLDAQDTSNIDEIHPTGGISGYDLDGTGVNIGLWDTGTIRSTHEQIRGRAVNIDRDTGPFFHSTHVAGTIAGSGAGNLQAQGMAPNAMLYCWSYHNDLNEMEQNADLISVSNHSYATSVGWNYDELSMQWKWYGNPKLSPYESHLLGRYQYKNGAFDRIVREHNIISIAAAGNQRNSLGAFPMGSLGGAMQSSADSQTAVPFNDLGYDTINPIGVAKNIITVGAVVDLTHEPPAPYDSTMTSFSSWGPTDDGRIKPDLTANGYQLISMGADSDTHYDRLSGTSSSAPVVTGAAACLVQLFRQKFENMDPSAAFIKCLMIHTAIYSGFAKPGPDYRFGWGLLDARAAADFLSEHSRYGRRIELDSYRETPLEYTGDYVGSGPIKVTIAWSDPPAIPTAGGVDDNTGNLINDLDLSIIGPDGVHFPWTLDPSNPSQPACQNQENHRDNIEQVYIEIPQPGTYTIQVNGQVNQGPSQLFALCATGMRFPSGIPRAFFLSPYNTEDLSGTIPIQIYGASVNDVSRITCKVNGMVFDNPETEGIDGEFIFDPPLREAVYFFDLNTQLLIDGECLLEAEVTDTQGVSSQKRITLSIRNNTNSDHPPATSIDVWSLF